VTRKHYGAEWIAVAALTVLGLALRVLDARGALWLDEAWSATFAQQAATPLGVVFRINHDNNHILNTLWLQLVGPGAPPMLQRALSIACGTACAPLAALFAARRGAAAAIVAGLAFAISPILVTYGAEARGYAPMLAAAMAVLVLADRWLEEDRPPATVGIAVCALLGTLAQPLMIAPLLAITGWAVLILCRRDGARTALVATARVMMPALVAATAVVAMMVVSAEHAHNGFAIGSYVPFTATDWSRALGAALGWTLGFFDGQDRTIIVALTAMLAGIVLWFRRADPRTPFYAVAILAYPLVFVVLRIGNAGIARYYLLASVGLLLLLAELTGRAIERPGALRWLSCAAIVLFVVGCGRMDAAIISNLRADPTAMMAAMKADAPTGATVMLPDRRMEPVLDWAARDADYPLTIVPSGCAPVPFVLIDNDRERRTQWSARLCGGDYRLIAMRSVIGLSGTDWWLYRRIG
jgi:hypothetical protein